MFEVERIEDWKGQQVVDPDGNKIGKLDDVLTDVDSGEPAFGSVKTGLFGRKLNVVPLEGATLSRDHVQVQHSEGAVKDAPQIDSEAQLTAAEGARVRSHYGLEHNDRSDETLRYESAAAREARREEAAEAREKAEELEQEASKHDDKADDKQAEIEKLEQQKREEQTKRDEAAERAEELRKQAEIRDPEGG